MNRIVECVPNFSEGQRPEVIERLWEAVEAVATATVLGTHRDPDHNRSVITFVASPEHIVEAAVRVVDLASRLINLRDHSGEHPRIGATDVLPFIPVTNVTMEECVALAHEAGRRIAVELGIPVFFYELAAMRADRVKLENVRRRGFEELRTRIAIDPERSPDVGEPRLHETAGAIAVGARPFLIAFNVNLRSNDVKIARAIAHAVRERDGGLPFLKALGFDLHSRGIVQVSMNLINYQVTGMAQAFEAVKSEAEKTGVEIASTEIVGLIPEAALDRDAAYFPLLENFSEDLVLEHRIASRNAERA
ncbi:MAG TPA: glutamate formimidoyltransferase [Pyrinomonadaceae bacterium]|nr:glutamate formimidoyltransferase [Pyrinomonadaceae bacterium]